MKKERRPSRIRRALSRLVPPVESLKLVSWFVFIIGLLIIIASSLSLFRAIGPIFTLVVVIALFLLALLSGLLFNLVLVLLRVIPPFFRTTIIFLLIVLMLGFFLNFPAFILTFLYLFVALYLIAISIWKIRSVSRWELSWIRALIYRFIFLIGFFALAFWVYWLIQPGSEIEAPVIASLQTDYRPEVITYENPANYGPYPVAYTTYGSGRDAQRAEYGIMADLLTEAVDGSKFVSGWDGLSGKLRTWYFGFDETELPLNGRVWYPDGVGPFPLVLIVHGNHLAQEYSDPGYSYLGELWASRGMITVSVDQNFINGSFTDIFGGLKDENDARGWLLLEHLRQWKQWNETPDNPFYSRVDMDNIALVGHSRGGEAVAHAALFNRLPFYPDDAGVSFDYNFNIRSIIAIAPCDGQYTPSIVRTPLSDINYLTVHGSHDGDVDSFSGLRQFERVEFSPEFDGFAATLYIHRANHGQFNTVWGNRDIDTPRINQYNLRQLLAGEEQRRIARVFLTAFLETTLMFAPEYEKLFLDYRAAPPHWLPETVYLQQYRRYGMYPIANFDEDLDLSTTTIAGGRITTNNLTDWYERRIRLKHYSMDSKAVYLGWNTEADTLIGSCRIDLPPFLISRDQLYLTLADTGQSPSPHESEEAEEDTEENDDTLMVAVEPEEEEEKEEAKPDYIDFTIRLADSRGREISFPLSSFAPLQPKLEVKLGKLPLFHREPYGENIKQLFIFDLTELSKLEPGFDLNRLASVELVFDRTPKGLILIDEVGFME